MTTETMEKKRSVKDLNNEQLVKVYIQLRDRRSARKRAYEMEDEDDKTKQEFLRFHRTIPNAVSMHSLTR